MKNNILTMPPVKATSFTKAGSLSAKSSQSAKGVDLKTSQPASLSACQLGSVSLFIHAIGALSLPRSIGEIYRILLSTLEPLSLGDSTKARTRLGWKPKVSFDALVEMVVVPTWFLTSRKSCSSLGSQRLSRRRLSH